MPSIHKSKRIHLKSVSVDAIFFTIYQKIQGWGYNELKDIACSQKSLGSFLGGSIINWPMIEPLFFEISQITNLKKQRSGISEDRQMKHIQTYLVM